MASKKLVGIAKTAELLGVGISTLRAWDDSGALKAERTKGGHRRYRIEDIERLQGIVSEDAPPNDCAAIYARVSSHDQKQKGDLERQKLRLLEYCANKQYRVGYVFEETLSGMNDNRPKLHRLFDLAIEHKINRLVIEHKDRLARFNFSIFVRLFESHGVAVEWCEEVLPKSYEAELVEDMLSLLSSFSAKIYGRRSAERRKKKTDGNS